MNLKNCCVLVTRPKPQGIELCEKIRTKHGNPLFFPTLEIAGLATDDPQIAALNHYDWLIFMSPQAVCHGVPLIQKHHASLPDSLRLAAIGAGTMHALQHENMPSTICPETEWTSEGLLDLPEFQAINGKRIAIIKGEGGRETLAEGLTARGAKVHEIAVYRRQLPTVTNLDKYLDLFQQQKIDIIVCASGESMRNLLELTGDANRSFVLSVPLMVVSERLVILAEELQWKHVFLAENASHDSIINALETVQIMLGKIYGGNSSKK